MRRYTAIVVGVVLVSACHDLGTGDPSGRGGRSGDGNLRINISNVALRAPFTELDLHITKVELFYGTTPPAAPNGDCDAPGQTLIVTPPFPVVVDLTRVGDSFVGEFSAPAGLIAEVRLVSDNTQGVEQGLTRRAHPLVRCGGGDTSGLFRLVPLPGQSIAVIAGDTTQIEVQLDPTRALTVDGEGGNYGQKGGADNTPGSCGNGGPCGKPFKLASDYGVLAFILSAAKDWRDTMTSTPLPHVGCFRGVYPGVEWHEVPCTTASGHPLGPAPQNVGGGAGDFAAQTTGLISQAVGSFDGVTGVMSIDSTSTGGDGPFTLQINPNFFGTTSCGDGCTACATGCLGWQQFVYDDDSRPFNGPKAYMQYWLVGFAGSCPRGWNTSTAGCFLNSSAIGVPGPLNSNLAAMTLVGKVTTDMDTVILSTNGGDMSAVGADNVVGLLPNWTVAEFNVFGDANSSTANFNAGSTMVVRTAITDGTANAPNCINGSTTAEMNNLSLVPPCCQVAGAEPAIVFTESNVAGAMSTCPPGGGCTPGLKVLADAIASSGPNCFGSSQDYDFGQAACDAGFELDTCSATFVNDGSDNDSTCTATPTGGCGCHVRATTPNDCIKSVHCHVLVTERPTAAPVPQIVTNQTGHNGSDCFGTSHDFDFPAACDAGFTLGNCSAHLITDPNGSTCTAAPIGACGCRLHINTPADCFKFASCSLIATEVPAPWTPGCPTLRRF